MAMKVMISIPVPEDFDLEKAVCNHGFFMMAPNKWLPSTKTLKRPLRLANPDLPSVTAFIQRHPFKANFLAVIIQLSSKVERLSRDDQQFIQSQVERMLHISEEDGSVVKEFHKVNPKAKEIGFARIFRSPTLFEDIVKSILLCNISWTRSLDMAKALCLCEHKLLCFGRGSGSGQKRKRSCKCDCKDNNFPSPKQIASLDMNILGEECNLGYRAEYIHKLAKRIENGSLKLEDIARPHDDPHECYARLKRLIKGVGSFVAANVMMCIGFYQYIPIDSETTKHLKQVHGKTDLKGKEKEKAQAEVIAQIYDKFAPFQCLAYWMERVEFYEEHLGKLSDLPESSYGNVTSTTLTKNDSKLVNI